MKIIIIGRTKALIDSANLLIENGHEIVGIITSRAAPDYQINEIDFKNYAKELNIPFIHHPKIKLEILLNYFEKINPDIAISINYSGIIIKDVVDFFPLGILNVHGGDLPKYRGNACQAWAIINGEDKIGLCVHKMIGDELDSGDIISRTYIKIGKETSIGDIYKKFEKLIPNMLIDSINKLDSDPEFILEKQSTNPEKIIRCYPRNPEDGLINWNNSSVQIHKLIRASGKPYPGAFTFLNSDRVIIYKSRVVEEKKMWYGIPGQFAEFTKDNTLNILTGDGKLELIEIEFKGKKCKPGKIFNSLRSRFKNIKDDI
jgi:UDP-4-amino-4-deoxy-L-arabinose formyltransferase/UDP-glucuronic acid dehydrogenase (UDP-4-keto-hexauronic acid decarboxylating)